MPDTPTASATYRAQFLQKQLALQPGVVPVPRVQRLYQRYLVGELTWEDVCALRDAPQHLP